MSRLIHLLPVLASVVVLAILALVAFSVDRADSLVATLPWIATLFAYLWVGRRSRSVSAGTGGEDAKGAA